MSKCKYLILHTIAYIFFNIYEKGLYITEVAETGVGPKHGDWTLSIAIYRNNDISKVAFDFTDIVSFNPEVSGAKYLQSPVKELEKKF